MENNNGANNKPDSTDEATPSTSKNEGRKENPKSKSKSDKTTEKTYPQKTTLCESWRSTDAVRKVEIILLTLVAIGGVGYLIAYITVSVKQNSVTQSENRPHVIISRPPTLYGSIVCQITDNA